MKSGAWFAVGLVVGAACLAAGFWARGALLHVPASVQAGVVAVDAATAAKLARLADYADTQMVEPSVEAHESALSSDLQTLRSQLELYKVQHLDQCPGIGPDGKFDGELFAKQLLERTDERGRVGAGAFGPYLQRMPANPFIDGPAARNVSGGPGAAPGDGSTGWWFDTINGYFFANDSTHSTM